MHRIRTTTAAFAASLALGIAAVPQIAGAEEEPPSEPCAVQQTQLDRATAKLEWITALFEAKQARVAKARKAVAAADTRAEKRAARAVLARAKARKAEVAQEKRAQQVRVEMATARLEACLAQAG